MVDKKYIVVTGGVISGLGKGVTAASIGFFFSENKRVVPIKLDGYLNSDPGTMNPIEHGEVFVLDDGHEVDMDFGHYERFLGQNATKSQSITMGKIFSIIRTRERNGDYLGKTVQMIPHVTDLIQEKIISVGNENNAEVILVEVGGTIGDMENELFVEGLRQLESKVGRDNILYIHLTYVPIPYGVKEQKTKPTQQSINLLYQRGVRPSIIIARCADELSEHSKSKIALFANTSYENVFSAPDLKSIYQLPEVFEKQGLIERVCKELDIKVPSKKKLNTWSKLLSTEKKKKLKVAIAGKYTGLEDSYASIIESLSHCEFNLGVDIEVVWIETSGKIDRDILGVVDAIIVPGGFGNRGVEGKIEVIKYARENKTPYLGICYGLQLAVIEFARNVCNIKDANTHENFPNCKEPVVTLLDEQKKVVKMGGTMRLGAYDAKLIKSSIKDLYEKFNLIDKDIVSERHRHRYEVNPQYVKEIEKGGMIISGKSVDRSLVEFIELPKNTHPYFVATQAHPELKSKLEKPAPLFYGLIKAAMEK